MCHNTGVMADNHTQQTTVGVSDEDFAEAAANPSSFSIDGLSQTNRSLSELIAADKYMRQRNRAASRRHPLSGLVTHLIPPGPCDR